MVSSVKRLTILIMIGVCVMLFFSSCKNFGFKKTKSEKDVLQEKSDLILDSFSQNDINILKDILSDSALDTSDLQKGFDYCVELLGENIVSTKNVVAPISDYWDSGKSSKKSDASFTVTTSSGKEYSIYFEYWYKNDFDTSKIGVNRIRIVEEDSALLDPEFKKSSDYVRSGIYNPSWDDENTGDSSVC